MSTENGSPAPATASAGHRPSGRRVDTPRVCVAFTFFRLQPRATALAAGDRQSMVDEFVRAVENGSEHLGLLRPYSVMGTRADADFLLWQAAETPEGLQRFAAALRGTRLFAFLEMPHHFLAMTRRSAYVHEGENARQAVIKPEGSKYLFVYPFVKTRAWYALPMAERQRMMNEHIAVGRSYPNVKINTTYSYGLDDQEFVVAFEGDSVGEFLDLVMELRSSEASSYTLRDTPSFTAVATPLPLALEMAIGLGSGAAIAPGAAPLPALVGAPS
jgi:chlorite dismutase